jgi:hypothetical protein
MRDIFISYRRVDTEASGGHLYADLCRLFGSNSVFMDTRSGGIPWGADWEKSLNDALEGCEALIVLIGPQWVTCERSPGLRRLDAPDDWVRREIATVLKREKPALVAPVLFQGAPPAALDGLPDDLRALGFHKRQAYQISESNWEVDTKRLVDALATAIPRLRQLHDLATAETGIRLLEKLIRENRKVSDAISRSWLLIENTDRGIDEIRLLKDIHDALHEIESKCLIPLRNGGTGLPVDGFRRKFVQQERAIRAWLCELAPIVAELPVLLQVDLPDHLMAGSVAFQNVAVSRSADDHVLVVSKLEELVSEIPVRLNDAIENAGRQVELRRLMDMMATVVSVLNPAGPASDSELRPMIDGIAALGGLRDELTLRMREHGVLQSLDNFLRSMVSGQRRAGTAGRIESATLVTNWDFIKRLRSRFKEPFSPEMEEGHRNLQALEPEIEAAVMRGDEPNAVAQVNAYFNEVGDLFRLVDNNLKEFCFALREKTRPLKTIIDMARHA